MITKLHHYYPRNLQSKMSIRTFTHACARPITYKIWENNEKEPIPKKK